ncbi:hypothetical protein SUGI_0976350 [Cryptomeria japonica]|nr:hypothetical protein SUGI_0976350 [Cryptomeria japonica]
MRKNAVLSTSVQRTAKVAQWCFRIEEIWAETVQCGCGNIFVMELDDFELDLQTEIVKWKDSRNGIHSADEALDKLFSGGAHSAGIFDRVCKRGLFSGGARNRNLVGIGLPPARNGERVNQICPEEKRGRTK